MGYLPESAVELDKLVDILKENPEFKVKLSSYTDDRGSVEYNLGLSWLRTKTAMDYIVSKGIQRSRISGENYGETQLVNECPKPCTPEKYRENRRTEILIPGILAGEPTKQIKGDFSSDQQKMVTGVKSESDVTEPGKGFLLVLGSFPKDNEAEKFIGVLKKDGINISVAKNSGNTRIGITYNSFTKAKKAQEFFKDKYRDCWILPYN